MSETATQATYLPPARLTGTTLIPLGELPPNSELIGPEPDRRLVESIWTLGQLEPLIVSEGVTGYLVHSGRRRLKALRRCLDRAGEDGELAERFGVARVTILANPEDVDGYLDLAANQRKANPVSDLAAIELVLTSLYGGEGAFFGGSATDDQLKAVARATGLPVALVRKRYQLRLLPPVLKDALGQGQLTVSVAEAVARLGPEAQDSAVAAYLEHGKLTAADLKAARQVGRAAAGLQLDFTENVPVRAVNDASQRVASGLRVAILATLREWGGYTEDHPDAGILVNLGERQYQITVLVEEVTHAGGETGE